MMSVKSEICYRPDSGEEIRFNWSDIRYIDDELMEPDQNSIR